METNSASGDTLNNGQGSENNNNSHPHRPKVESIEIVTSISNINVHDDGSITPTLATVVGTSLFENGVLTVAAQKNGDLMKSGNINTIMDIAENITSLPASATASSSILPAGSSISSGSASPSTGAIDQQQQQQQQQQRQRELHYESANAVLVPPLNFAMVAPGVYRSGHPNKHNFPFMKKLGLKVIVQMSEEPYAPDLIEFLNEENIRRIHYKIEGNKEPFIEIDEEVIRSALVNILDARNHPLLIHCAKGKHRIGCLIGCLRKIQNWSMTSIFDEYRRFAGSKVLADQEFIEIFPAKVPYLLEYKPVWL
ncbi:hypothetical protein FBU30_003996 [Linnemannia zychae]|nr:hypothetical protein FBU30_003996 [Linnemannia zychae]